MKIEADESDLREAMRALHDKAAHFRELARVPYSGAYGIANRERAKNYEVIAARLEAAMRKEGGE